MALNGAYIGFTLPGPNHCRDAETVGFKRCATEWYSPELLRVRHCPYCGWLAANLPSHPGLRGEALPCAARLGKTLFIQTITFLLRAKQS